MNGCDCGWWSGAPCESTDDPSSATVEWMPVHLRSQHREARNCGSYPHNGARRLSVTERCAELILADDREWAERIR